MADMDQQAARRSRATAQRSPGPGLALAAAQAGHAETTGDGWRAGAWSRPHAASCRSCVALARQHKLGTACLPYLHQTQPAAVELPAGQSMAFVTVIGDTVQGAAEALIEGRSRTFPRATTRSKNASDINGLANRRL